MVLDVVSRYDIDGVHFDDYFYPYKERDAAGKEIDFPDEASWRRLGAHPGMSREDWRRDNVNQFIQRTYKAIKSAKPWVKFGLSPFGIWRPGNPPQVDGLDAYDKLYADSRRWLASGWVDYFAPQLYWPIHSPKQSFPLLLKWWARQNTRGRLLVPGLDITRIHGELKPSETLNEIRLTRLQAGAAGEIEWNLGSLMRNTALAEALAREVYVQPALMPPTPWLSRSRLPKPNLTAAMSARTTAALVGWAPAGKDPIRSLGRAEPNQGRVADRDPPGERLRPPLRQSAGPRGRLRRGPVRERGRHCRRPPARLSARAGICWRPVRGSVGAWFVNWFHWMSRHWRRVRCGG